MSQPVVYEHTFLVSPDDIDQLGHVNNVVYLRYAQDVAVAHWHASVSREHRESLVWVVRRASITLPGSEPRGIFRHMIKKKSGQASATSVPVRPLGQVGAWSGHDFSFAAALAAALFAAAAFFCCACSSNSRF